jgi:hypothetical protein
LDGSIDALRHTTSATPKLFSLFPDFIDFHSRAVRESYSLADYFSLSRRRQGRGYR